MKQKTRRHWSMGLRYRTQCECPRLNSWVRFQRYRGNARYRTVSERYFTPNVMRLDLRRRFARRFRADGARRPPLTSCKSHPESPVVAANSAMRTGLSARLLTACSLSSAGRGNSTVSYVPAAVEAGNVSPINKSPCSGRPASTPPSG
jgi:hypothetical protein